MADETDATQPVEQKKRRGPGRIKTAFVALVLGYAGGLVTPLLIPDTEPDCVKPTRVEYDFTSGTSTTVEYADDGTNGCGVELNFVEPGRGD